MNTFKTTKGEHIVTIKGEPRVFDTLIDALKYIASRY